MAIPIAQLFCATHWISRWATHGSTIVFVLQMALIAVLLLLRIRLFIALPSVLLDAVKCGATHCVPHGVTHCEIVRVLCYSLRAVLTHSSIFNTAHRINFRTTHRFTHYAAPCGSYAAPRGGGLVSRTSLCLALLIGLLESHCTTDRMTHRTTY